LPVDADSRLGPDRIAGEIWFVKQAPSNPPHESEMPLLKPRDPLYQALRCTECPRRAIPDILTVEGPGAFPGHKMEIKNEGRDQVLLGLKLRAESRQFGGDPSQ
jgi:hypothetical protein